MPCAPGGVVYPLRSRRIEARETSAPQDMAFSSRLDERLIKGIRICGEICGTWQAQFNIERVHSEDVLMNIGWNVGRGTRTIIFCAKPTKHKEIVDDLQAVRVSSHARVLRQPASLPPNVIHSPMRKGGSNVIKRHDKGTSV